jgi:hypothetical protein
MARVYYATAICAIHRRPPHHRVSNAAI